MNAKPLLLAVLLAGCASSTPHNLQQELAQSAVPAAWMFESSDRAVNQHTEWWRDYSSAELDQLVARGLAHNQNLAAAGFAWQKSRIALENSQANRAPDYSGSIGAGVNRNLSHGGRTSQNYSTSLGISYQTDLWGKLRLAESNAQWESEASAEDLLATRLSLIGDIVSAYLQIANLNDQLALNAAYRQNAAQTLELTRTKERAGSASQLDLRQAEQNRTSLDASRDQLQNQRQQAETTLASLLGAPVSRVISGEPSLKALTVPAIDSGIPAHLLAQRPDLRAAQYRLQQNIGNIAIAERDYYPDLSLGASLGTGADRLLQLLHNPVGALTANITLPFLNAHKKALAEKEAETSYQQSLASYRQTLYRALGETQNAILNLQQGRDEAASLQTRLAQAKDIENLTRIRYQAGAASLQDVLEKENATRSVEESLQNNRYEQLTRSLTLHLALGGNLQDNESARPQPSPANAPVTPRR